MVKGVENENKGERQERLQITKEMVTTQSRKIPNWKAPGPDGVQGFWIKKLTSLHERIAKQMNDMINNNVAIPGWMTTGRTVLCQKDKQKGNVVENYRPISCLPLMWKLLTGIMADCMYRYLEDNDKLPVEQKGCRKKCRGTKDQLLVDKMILMDSKRKHKNLAMAWVDYKKAYDMVPHSWMIECLQLANIAENIIDFLKRSMVRWKTELTSHGEILGTVNIKRGIFQGDSLSPLLFVLCMIPLTRVLRKARAGYMVGDVKVNHLLFMDDLKMFGKNMKEVDSLVSTVHMVSKDIGMEFGIQKCGVAVLKKGKLHKSEGIKLPEGKTIKDVENEGYKYLGILELDKIKEKEMKETFGKEYLRRVRLVMASKLHGRNKIQAINTWAVSLMRYGGGVIKWNQKELQDLDVKTRKIMTMNRELHPRSDVARLYVPRKKGGRGLISCERSIRTEENNLGWYIKHSKEILLRKVGESGIVDTGAAKKPEEYKNETTQQQENMWKEKPMHGQYLRNMVDVDWEKTWKWISKGDLKGCTEALICSAQEQSLRTNYIKFHKEKTAASPMCRLCSVQIETPNHLVSGCMKLAQREYKRRHDNVARYVHWQLCEKAGLERASKWYEHKPEGVIENADFKILWDFMIQCDQIVENRKPDIVIINKKKKEVKIIDIAIPIDNRVKEKEGEKIEKYEKLKEEIERIWKMRAMVIPVVIGALGAVSRSFDGHIGRLEVRVPIEVIQKTALLGTARILRKVLSL